jgi:hypothetical protein
MERKSMEWIEFNPDGGPLPPERRYVLCQIAEKPGTGLPPAVAVGYIRIFSNDSMFVIPGVGGTVTHYCDCLGDDFIAPLWPGSGREFNMSVQAK